MAETGIPDDVRRFVAAEIQSVEQVEILLRLHRQPSAWWTAEDLAGELRTSTASVAFRVAEMKGRGLLEAAEDGLRYRYRLTNPETERTVRMLDRFSKPMNSIRDFSDAFRLRKGGGD